MKSWCLALALAAGSIAGIIARAAGSMESSPILRLHAGTAVSSQPSAGQPKNRLRLRTPQGVEHPWDGSERIESNGREYGVFLLTDPSPIPANEEFSATVWVFRRNLYDAPLTDVTLDVDAFMPEHGHGMNRVPEITQRKDGGFDVKGLLFHMGGNWELYLDVTRGPITERAQRRVVLE
jgi:hypothetical protein